MKIRNHDSEFLEKYQPEKLLPAYFVKVSNQKLRSNQLANFGFQVYGENLVRKA